MVCRKRYLFLNKESDVVKIIAGGFIGLIIAVVIVGICDFYVQGDEAFILGPIIGGVSVTLGGLVALYFE